jgi:peptidoglycan/LPS O-acetylase OafA/YrhL
MPKSTERIAGFDWLRVLALGSVLFFHILVLLDRRAWTQFAGMSMGAFGVTLFLGLSGALIGKDTRPANEWIFARLKKIYPAYWIATILAFFATGISGYKQFGVIQFLWQLSGLGLYFAEDLINVATWFIGLLLALYLSVYLARKTIYCDALLQFFAIGSAILVMFNASADYFGNCFAFYGAILAFRTSSPARSLWMLAIPCAMLSRLNLEFQSTALVWVLIALGLGIRSLPKPIAWISRYSYEFYLVHGIFLVGSLKLLRAQEGGFRSLAAMLIGVVASLAAAIVIQKLSDGFFKRMAAIS